MTEEQFDKLLSKIPTDKVYDDLLSPGLKRVGEVLATVFDLGNLILLPFKLVNERSKITFRRNLEIYEEKLSKIDEKDLCEVPQQIGLPIIDKLTIVNQEELSHAFTNLLTKASSHKTINIVHPAFFNTLNDISQDEAILLMALSNELMHPFIDVHVITTQYPPDRPEKYGEPGAKTREQLQKIMDYQDGIQKTSNPFHVNLTGLENEVKIYFPENIDLYLENLERLGVIEFKRTKYLANQLERYDKLANKVYKGKIDEVREEIYPLNTETLKYEIEIKHCFFKFTEFGQSFIEAVIK